MISKLDDIKRYWSGDAIDIDDTDKDDDGKTAFDKYLLSQAEAIARRLKKWVGKDAYDDATKENPEDPDRAEAIREAELNLLHAAICEQLIRMSSSGIEKDISLPSGTRISLKDWSQEDYQSQISSYLDNAYRAVLEYL